MARPAALKFWLLLALVLVAHAAALEWLARQREPLTVLQAMAPPMFTRLLQPEEPPPVVAAAPAPPPKPRKRRRAATVVVAAPPQHAASAPVVAAPVAEPQAELPIAPPAEPQLAQALEPAPAASVPESASSSLAASSAVATVPAASAASAAASAPVPTDALQSWPTDTRLSYRLGGQFRNGELYGDAQVQWQRQGSDYQVRVDIDITLWAELIMTSQGEVTPEGLVPRAYEEIRPGKKRRAAQFGDEGLALENGKSALRPPGMQDTASQFVELAHRFATGRELLQVGNTVSFWMARPGAVDRWTYDVVEREMLQTPNLGAVEAFRLKPRPIANPRGNVTAEMWFAPSLQYLPVRIKVLMGENAYVDLMVEKIEQQ